MSIVTDPRLDAQMARRMRGPSLVIWLCVAAVAAFLLWASFATLDQIVRGSGEIVSPSRAQSVQNLEGGILSDLYVTEGQIVEEGQLLARLHTTPYQTAVDDLGEQIATLSVRRLRLEAEQAGLYGFSVPEDLEARVPDIVTSERALLEARQIDFQSRQDGAKRILAEAEQEKRLLEDLLAQKIVALIEVTRARKAHADAQTQLDEIVTQARLERAQAHADTLKELATLRQNAKVAQDQLQRTRLVAPMRGVVQGLAVTTIGGVLRPGEEIAQIIPLEDRLSVEARVSPKDIAGVRPGQDATIKLSAYDYTIHGALKGQVTLVSADTFKDERQSDGDPHYRVTVALDPASAGTRQADIALRPGMLAEVELHTGARTVLQYLLKPLLKSGEALREP